MKTDLVPSPQQAITSRGIGASQASVALGVNPYRRPIELWRELTGRAQPFAGNQATYWGMVLEPVIRAYYVESNQVTVHVPPESLWHRELPWLRATPDGIVVDDALNWLWIGPQVKNVGVRQTDRWVQSPPVEYFVQAIIEMAVADLPRLDFAVLIGGQEYRQLTVERDRAVEADVLTELAAFWKSVEDGVEPPIDGSDSYRDHLLEKIERTNQTVSATADIAARVARWKEIEFYDRELNDERNRIRNELLAFLAEKNATAVQTPEGIIKLTEGRSNTAWQSIARKLVERAAIPDDELQALIAEHTTPSNAYLMRPRAWYRG